VGRRVGRHAVRRVGRRVGRWAVARDAARALLVQDVIAQEHFDILYGPWASVIDTVRAPMP
jgi:hypothetical protein